MTNSVRSNTCSAEGITGQVASGNWRLTYVKVSNASPYGFRAAVSASECLLFSPFPHVLPYDLLLCAEHIWYTHVYEVLGGFPVVCRPLELRKAFRPVFFCLLSESPFSLLPGTLPVISRNALFLPLASTLNFSSQKTLQWFWRLLKWTSPEWCPRRSRFKIWGELSLWKILETCKNKRRIENAPHRGKYWISLQFHFIHSPKVTFPPRKRAERPTARLLDVIQFNSRKSLKKFPIQSERRANCLLFWVHSENLLSNLAFFQNDCQLRHSPNPNAQLVPIRPIQASLCQKRTGTRYVFPFYQLDLFLFQTAIKNLMEMWIPKTNRRFWDLPVIRAPNQLEPAISLILCSTVIIEIRSRLFWWQFLISNNILIILSIAERSRRASCYWRSSRRIPPQQQAIPNHLSTRDAHSLGSNSSELGLRFFELWW